MVTLTLDVSNIVDTQANDASSLLIPFSEMEQITADILNGIQSFDQITMGAQDDLTIASGAITITSSNHLVETESGAITDDLDTINGDNGDVLFIAPKNGARTTVVKHNTGNVLTMTEADLDLDELYKFALLVRGGDAKWRGHVLNPGRVNVGARLRRDAVRVLSDAAWTDLLIDTVAYGDSNMLVSNAMEFQTAGKYLVNMAVEIDANATGYRGIRANLNSGTIIGTSLKNAVATALAPTYMQSSFIYNFSQGDSLACELYQNSGGILGIREGSEWTAWMSAQLLAR